MQGLETLCRPYRESKTPSSPQLPGPACVTLPF